MKMYEVSYLKSGIYQSNIIRTENNSDDISKFFKENRPDAKVIDIRVATADSLKPGKPIIDI